MNNKGSSEEQGDSVNTQAGYLGITPPQGRLPPRGQRAWVERPEQLLQAVERLEQAPVVAIDAEFTQMRSHTQSETTGPRLALLQLAIDGYCFVVDALRLRDLEQLNVVVDNPNILVLLHGAGADLRVMAERGLSVAFYYDLEATSRSVFGQHESSLAAMLQRALNMRLDKSLQRTDWTRRPLPPAMVAYAARDAEMTLALYYWLQEHFAWALRLHASSNLQEPVAEWIEPFLHGSLSLPAEVIVTEAIKQGNVRDQDQVLADCREALLSLTHPMRKSRLLRLITELSLVQLASEVRPLLLAPTADERAGAIRTLSRLGSEDARELIMPLLQDPVHDVRKAAQTALRLSGQKEPRSQWATPKRQADGSRSWTVGDTSAPADSSGGADDDWRARLRSLINDD
ncbi:MAG TPA: HEAT repeat domain-containing protein [Ktedonobacteraceae bacterium]